MKLCTDIHSPLWLNPHDFGDCLTFHLAPSSGQICNLFNTLVFDQIPAKLMTLPSASAVLLVLISKR